MIVKNILNNKIFYKYFLLSIFTICSISSVQANDYKKQVRTAVIIYQISSFISGPYHNGNDEFIYCISGHGPMHHVLPDVIAGEKLDGKPLRYKRVSENDEIHQCNVVFLHQSPDSEQVLKQAESFSILTITEDEMLLEHGVMVVLKSNKNKIRPIINLSKLKIKKFKASAKLLRLSIIV